MNVGGQDQVKSQLHQSIVASTVDVRRRQKTQFASYGCIRMYNHDIVDLFERVQVGTLVVVR